MSENKNRLIPEEDYNYELEQAKKRAEEDAAAQAEEQLAKQREEEYKKNHSRELNDRKIELMKLKQGIIESSDIVKEEEKTAYKESFGEKISNIWFRNKWLIVFAVFVVFAFSYIIYDQVSKTKPDLTVLVLSSNYNLYYRTEELEDFLAQYCDDLNGDGEVYVQVYNISTDYSDTSMATSGQAQLMSQLQSGENIILISDAASDFTMHDFREEYQGNDRFTELGLTLNCELVRSALKWEAMTDDVYIGMREPTELFSTSLEGMQANYDEAYGMYSRIVEAVCASEK